ncbi:MAG: aldehyde dehydrogenase family protein [Actinobacteria bacterium]|nr:aldehyde dehydrogenase family protein [Actinomycetota bacterium]MCA1720811.1 aldehyde dehydrogenase family protein [Actinomycetota bacterium]
MTIAPERPADTSSFESLDPATGAVYATFPVHGEAEVQAAVGRARTASAWWQELGWAGRRARLGAWKALLANRTDDLAAVVHRENGKPMSDARLEITLAVDHIAWAAKNAPKVLGPRRISPGLMMANQAASLEYQPLGVIGVIGPWNYPVFTPMGSIAYALAAGNAVVFKPSEYTPAVGKWLVDTFAEVVPEQPVLQLLTGLGETGAFLCRAGVDKVAFTGSARTGKKVMAACAETLTPVLMECGGKDAMIVDDDADLDAAATAALWGGMANAGQTCIGIERIYVTERVYDDFLARLTSKAGKVTAGTSYGPITMPGQVDVIRRHIADAIERGGRAVTGGHITGGLVEPTILVDVPEDSLAVKEETFGPTLTVSKVRNVEEAVERSNDTTYGLAGAVFSKKRGMEIARQLRTGMTSVNQVIAFAGVPSLPFGGSGDSGFGRIHGADGLKEFTRAKAITRQRYALPVPLLSFDRTPKVDALLGRTVRFLHGRG